MRRYGSARSGEGGGQRGGDVGVLERVAGLQQDAGQHPGAGQQFACHLAEG